MRITFRHVGVAAIVMSGAIACSSSTSPSQSNFVLADMIVRNPTSVETDVVVDLPTPVAANVAGNACQLLSMQVPPTKSEIIGVTPTGGATTTYTADLGATGVWALNIGEGGPTPLGPIGQVSTAC